MINKPINRNHPRWRKVIEYLKGLRSVFETDNYPAPDAELLEECKRIAERIIKVCPDAPIALLVILPATLSESIHIEGIYRALIDNLRLSHLAIYLGISTDFTERKVIGSIGLPEESGVIVYELH